MTTMPFGKYRGVRLRDVPGDYFLWLCGRRGLADQNRMLYRIAVRRARMHLEQIEEAIEPAPTRAQGGSFRVIPAAEFVNMPDKPLMPLPECELV